MTILMETAEYVSDDILDQSLYNGAHVTFFKIRSRKVS